MITARVSLAVTISTLFTLSGCMNCGPQEVPDAGVDAGPLDAGPDAGLTDAGFDAGIPDAGNVDAGLDAGTPDAGTPDAGCALTLVRILNPGSSCRISVDGGPASELAEQVLCVNPGTLALELSPSADFQLGETPWHGTDGDPGGGDPGLRSPLSIGTWSSTLSLPSGRGRMGVAATRGHLYSIGGGAPFAIAEVLYAPVFPDGGVGVWMPTTPLPVPLLQVRAVAHQGRVYVSGGWDGNVAHAEVLVASINADGSLGDWSVASSFGQPRHNSEFVVHRGHLYVLGGTGSPHLGDGRMASVNGGVISSWSTTNAFAPGRIVFGAAASGDSLFIAGGIGGLTESYVADVQQTILAPSGAVSSWAFQPALASARSDFRLIGYSGSLFAFGGYGPSGYLGDVQVAAVSDGGLSPWVPSTSFPTPRMEHGAVIYDSRLYLLGGYQNQQLTDVQVAPVLGNTSRASLTVGTTTRCVWTCCEGLDGTACASTSPCP